MELQNQGFDHVEVTLRNLEPTLSLYLQMGFEKIGDFHSESEKGLVVAQGALRVVLKTPRIGLSHDFLTRHGEGICLLALEVKDAIKTYEQCIARGARSARKPQTWETKEGTLVSAEIYTPGDLRYAFIQRETKGSLDQPALFLENCVVSRLRSPSPLRILSIDHLTNNLPMGEMKTWVQFYQEVFQFKVTRHFDIRTGRTGLLSEVIESPCRRIKVPINEATEKESQVQEFVDRFKGAGVQHLAFLTEDIQFTLMELRKIGMKFLKVPHTYYEEVPHRVAGVTENLETLEQLGVLLDGEGGGYLLQIFSEEVLGPFFFELIQRKGNQGFGEGNFKALFEAIERDQVRRGVLNL